MSAINTFAFQSFICVPRTSRACLCVFAEETVHGHPEPMVTARWTIETAQDGSRRLVRHWFSNTRIDSPLDARKTR